MGGGEVADCAAVEAGDVQGPVDCRSTGRRAAVSSGGAAVGLRGADPDVWPELGAMNSSTLAVGDQPAPADDDEVVGGQRHLAHQVAGHEDRAALGGQRLACRLRIQTDALGVEAVDRLVEDQDVRVAEQRGGDAEPLAHAEGEARRPACVATAGQADQLEHLVDPAAGDAVGCGQRQQVVAGAAAGVDGLGVEQRADLVQRARQVAVGRAVDGDRAGGRGVEARGSSASWWTCRRRWGRGSR